MSVDPDGTTLGQVLASLRLAGLGDDVVDRLQTTLMVNLVVSVAGWPAEHVDRACLLAVGGASGPCTVLAADERSGLRDAAFANVALNHSRVQDDRLGSLHIGYIVVPTVLAVAEATSCDGSTLLEGLAAGYELAGAMEETVAARISGNGFRASTIVGAIAAAAAAAKVMQLSPVQLDSALAHACAFAGGTSESFRNDTDEYRFQGSVAADLGIRAAELAASGSVGASTAFDGPAGLVAAFARSTPPIDTPRVSAGAPHVRRITFSPYPVAGPMFAVIDGLVELMRDRSVKADDIQRITVALASEEAALPPLIARGPFTRRTQALASVPLCTAVAAVDGTVGMDVLQRGVDANVRRLANAVEVRDDPTRPPWGMTAGIEVLTADGAIHEISVDEGRARYQWRWPRAVRFVDELASTAPGSFPVTELVDLIAALPVSSPREIVAAAHGLLRRSREAWAEQQNAEGTR